MKPELTPRECEIMTAVCEGLSAKQTAERLGISSRTVEVHRAMARTKLGVRTSASAAVMFDRARRKAR